MTEYKNSYSKVKIICPDHGIFEQLPSAHISKKYGCLKCSINKKYLTTQYFIEKATKIHDSKYNYSLVEYKNNKTKIKIICPDHGIFEQLSTSHLRGAGCPKCAGKNKNTNDFIKEAVKIHDFKYNYSLVNYTNSESKVKIICSKHGIFEQIAISHLCGRGCPKCAGKNKSTNDFIKNVTVIHNNKYDYSLTEYNGNYYKIKIICPQHGIFEQLALNHSHNKQGCPYCKKSKGEQEIIKYLQGNNIEFEQQKTFLNCKNKKLLPFDFYLPKQNICIEYDGEQHFIAKKYWGGIKSLKYIQQNDEIKTKFCQNNSIILIRISYKDNINFKLKEILNELFNF